VFVRAVKESALILMQTVPTHIQVAELKKKLIKNVSRLTGATQQREQLACRLFSIARETSLEALHFPPIGCIRSVMFDWRLMGKIIRTVLCCVVYDRCHTHVCSFTVDCQFTFSSFFLHF